MRRRTYLGSLGVALATTIAGCLNSGSPDGDDSPTPDPTTSGMTDSPGTRPADGVTPAPGDNIDFSDVPCPVVGEPDETICSARDDLDDAIVALRPETKRFEPSVGDDTVEVLGFELTNQSERSFGFNPYAWSLHEYMGDAWRRVGPDAYPEPWMTIDAGQAYTYELAVEDRRTTISDGPMASNGPMTITWDLDSGTYALVVTVLLEGEEGPSRVQCAALFEVARQEN